MHRMPRVAVIALLAMSTTLGSAGCLGDVTQQVMQDPKLAERVMGAIAGRQDMAMGMLDRLVSTDSLRTAALDHLLQDDAVSQQLLDRVASNPMAMDYVLQAAVREPRMRDHIISVVKGIEMATAAK